MPTGRPTKYSKAIGDAICDGVRMGLSFSSACKAIGVPKSTGGDWREAFPDFSAAVDEAAGECEHALVERINKSINFGCKTTVVKIRDGESAFEETTTTTDDGISSVKWMLSRINPDRWSERAAIARMVEDRSRREVENRIQYLISVVDDHSKTQIATALMAAGLEASTATVAASAKT